jgi:repressor LexA
MNELTERQQQILGFIRGKQDSEGLTPTLREIAAHFRFSSPNAALAHVQALRDKGFLKSLAGRARSLQVVDPNTPKSRFRPRVVSVPIYGSIPAGLPQDTAQEEEGCVLIDVETLGIKPTARTFGLKVRGDSMTGKSIVDGDIAIIEHGVQPRPGDVVAALIDGQVTLKTFLLQKGKPYLRAENPRYPNLIPQEELQIQGVMVALVRKRK